MAAQHRVQKQYTGSGSRLKPVLYSSQKGDSSSPAHLKTAREKLRSVTADDAAQAVAYADKAMKTHRNSHNSNVGGKSTMPQSGRGNKTLGWFMDDIFEKKTGSVSMKTADALPSMTAKNPEEKKRRRGGRRGAKKQAESSGVAAVQPALSDGTGSVASEEFFEEKSPYSLSLPEVPREDYWTYDVVSDGYYYEQNGAKGWRRRMPNSALQKIKEQEMAHLASTTNGKLPSSSAPSFSHQHQQQAAAAQAVLLQSALFNQPIKYYDPNSDGFFYEMASVDGWKRRQPAAKPQPAAVPKPTSQRQPSVPTSYGAALARGEMPHRGGKPPPAYNYAAAVTDSSASSSVSEDTVAQDPFGFDCGFQMPRPNSLNYGRNEQMMPGFNADKFIQDLSFSGMDANKVLGPCSRTPSDAWAIRGSGWGSGSVDPTQQSSSPEEDAMGQLLKGLENIWAQPSPVKK